MDYDELEHVADLVETGGGLCWYGDDVRVGDEVVSGRDVVDLLTSLWKRASERAANGESIKAAHRQGYNAARRECRLALTNLSETFGDLYDDEVPS